MLEFAVKELVGAADQVARRLAIILGSSLLLNVVLAAFLYWRW